MNDEIVKPKRSVRNTLPTQERLKQLLSYDQSSGEFRWLASSLRGAVRTGKIAGCINIRNGYRQIQVDGSAQKAHRLAFMIMTGECPDQIDHANGDRSDNRWINLRGATGSENCGNRGAQKNNTSGVKGVHWSKLAGKWHARIMASGHRLHLGYFDNIADAAEAYRVAADAVFGKFANPIIQHGSVRAPAPVRIP